jgi:hypothetical protein
MSCYIRHMKNFLDESGINPKSKEDRKDVDLAIRAVIGKNPEDRCNEVWKDVKIWLHDEEKSKKLALELKKNVSIKKNSFKAV